MVGVKNSLGGLKRRGVIAIILRFDDKNNEFTIDWGNFIALLKDEGGSV